VCSSDLRVKRETAAEIASILAFNAIKNNDKVGVILFTDRVEKYIPPKKGSSHIWRVIKEIFTFSPEHRNTNISEALQFLGRVSRKKTVSFIISDFIDADYEKKMGAASKRHELISILLSDPGDFELPERGILLAEDLETGKTFYIDASDSSSRKKYTNIRKKAYDDTVSSIRKTGVDVIEMNTGSSVVDALVRYFRLRERLAGK
jgi:uncharacterized protein (DUF58 family)